MRPRVGRPLRSSSSRRSTRFPRHVIFGIDSCVSDYASFVCHVYDSGNVSTGGPIVGLVGTFRKD